MKKSLLLPIMAVAALASNAWANISNFSCASGSPCTYNGSTAYCQFSTGCFEISIQWGSTNSCAQGSCTTQQLYDNCAAYGSLFTGVTNVGADNNYGEGVKCNGTFQNVGADPNRQALGCCNWDTEGSNCWTIWSGTDPTDGQDGSTKVELCNGGSNRFWNGQCPSEPSCPTGAPAYDGKNPAEGFCCWPDYCGPIGGSLTSAQCTTDYGTIVSNCNQCTQSGGQSSAYQPPPSSDSWGTPSSDSWGSIRQLSLAVSSNVVKAINNGVNLQLMSDAKVRVYDLKGNMVRSYDLAQGSYNVQFSDLARGTYMVKVSGSSWKQTIAVPVK
jgi:hypothetical protein